MPAIEQDDEEKPSTWEGGYEANGDEYEEGLLTGPGASQESESEQPLPVLSTFARVNQGRELPGYGDDDFGGDIETLSELSEAPTDNASACPSLSGCSDPQRSRRGWFGSASALPYPLLRLNNDQAEGQQTRFEATLNLLNNLMGAGLLSMPRAFASSGLVTGLALMGLIAVANRYTLLQVLWMSQAVLGSESCSYPEIGRHVFGQKGLVAVLTAYLLFTGGILTAYLIAITDILRQLSLFGSAPRFILVLTAVLVCMPGASLRSLRHVALVSLVCMAGVCTLVVTLTLVCVGDSLSPDLVNAPIEDRGRAGDVDLFRGDLRRLFSGVALFSLQFSVQAGGIEVLSRVAPVSASSAAGDQEAPSSLTVAEDISQVAFLIALVLSAILGAAAYLRFGDSVAGDVLLDFSPTAPYIPLMLAWVSYGFVVTCSFAFIMVPCRFAALDVFALRRRDHAGQDEGLSKDKFHRINAVILTICAIVAWVVEDLAQVLEFVGVWATMALAFVFPCSFLIELRRRQQNLPILSIENALPLGLIVLGLAVASASTAEMLGVFWNEQAGISTMGAEGQRAVVHNVAETLRPHGNYSLATHFQQDRHFHQNSYRGDHGSYLMSDGRGFMQGQKSR